MNTASRLQRLTRSLQTPLVVGHPVIAAANSATAEIAEIVGRLKDRGEQLLRSRNEPVRIWARPDLSIEEWRPGTTARCSLSARFATIMIAVHLLLQPEPIVKRAARKIAGFNLETCSTSAVFLGPGG